MSSFLSGTFWIPADEGAARPANDLKRSDTLSTASTNDGGDQPPPLQQQQQHAAAPNKQAAALRHLQLLSAQRMRSCPEAAGRNPGDVHVANEEVILNENDETDKALNKSPPLTKVPSICEAPSPKEASLANTEADKSIVGDNLNTREAEEAANNNDSTFPDPTCTTNTARDNTSTNSNAAETGTASEQQEYSVQFGPGSLGLRLEPSFTSNEAANNGASDGRMGCRVVELTTTTTTTTNSQDRDEAFDLIQPGDIVIAVDNADVSTWKYADIVHLLQLKQGAERSIMFKKLEPTGKGDQAEVGGDYGTKTKKTKIDNGKKVQATTTRGSPSMKGFVKTKSTKSRAAAVVIKGYAATATKLKSIIVPKRGSNGDDNKDANRSDDGGTNGAVHRAGMYTFELDDEDVEVIDLNVLRESNDREEGGGDSEEVELGNEPHDTLLGHHILDDEKEAAEKQEEQPTSTDTARDGAGINAGDAEAEGAGEDRGKQADSEDEISKNKAESELEDEEAEVDFEDGVVGIANNEALLNKDDHMNKDKGRDGNNESPTLHKIPSTCNSPSPDKASLANIEADDSTEVSLKNPPMLNKVPSISKSPSLDKASFVAAAADTVATESIANRTSSQPPQGNAVQVNPKQQQQQQLAAALRKLRVLSEQHNKSKEESADVQFTGRKDEIGKDEVIREAPSPDEQKDKETKSSSEEDGTQQKYHFSLLAAAHTNIVKETEAAAMVKTVPVLTPNTRTADNELIYESMLPHEVAALRKLRMLMAERARQGGSGVATSGGKGTPATSAENSGVPGADSSTLRELPQAHEVQAKRNQRKLVAALWKLRLRGLSEQRNESEGEGAAIILSDDTNGLDEEESSDTNGSTPRKAPAPLSDLSHLPLIKGKPVPTKVILQAYVNDRHYILDRVVSGLLYKCENDLSKTVDADDDATIGPILDLGGFDAAAEGAYTAVNDVVTCNPCGTLFDAADEFDTFRQKSVIVGGRLSKKFERARTGFTTLASVGDRLSKKFDRARTGCTTLPSDMESSFGTGTSFNTHLASLDDAASSPSIDRVRSTIPVGRRSYAAVDTSIEVDSEYEPNGVPTTACDLDTDCSVNRSHSQRRGKVHRSRSCMALDFPEF